MKAGLQAGRVLVKHGLRLLKAVWVGAGQLGLCNHRRGRTQKWIMIYKLEERLGRGKG